MVTQNCPLVSPETITMKHGVMLTTQQNREVFNMRRYISQFSFMYSVREVSLSSFMTEGSFFLSCFSNLANTNLTYTFSFFFANELSSPNNSVLKSVGAMQAHKIQLQILGAN